MRGQLERLIEVTSLSNVTIQVIPFEAGAHPALESDFAILEFAAPVGSVVYVEGLIGFFYFNRPKDIERYRLIFETLSSLAYSQNESIKRIDDVNRTLKRSNSLRLATVIGSKLLVGYIVSISGNHHIERILDTLHI
jgi:hypothetical protein